MGLSKLKGAGVVVLASAVWIGCGSSDGSTSGSGGAGPMVVNVDEVEPNNGPDVNGAQDLGTIAEGTLVIHGELASGGTNGQSYTGDFDLFAFTLPEAGSVEITVDWTAAANVDFALYDPKAVAVVSDGTTAQPAKGTLASGNGKYILGLFSKDNATPYTATVVYKKAGTGTTTGTGGGNCPMTPVKPQVFGNGCTLNATSAPCQTLSTGGVLELDWTTNHTFCEGPHHFYLLGDPPASWVNGNAYLIKIDSQDGSGHLPDERSGMTRNIGGYLRINADDVSHVMSSTGIYYYLVANFSETAATEAIAFRYAP